MKKLHENNLNGINIMSHSIGILCQYMGMNLHACCFCLHTAHSLLSFLLLSHHANLLHKNRKETAGGKEGGFGSKQKERGGGCSSTPDMEERRRKTGTKKEQ